MTLILVTKALANDGLARFLTAMLERVIEVWRLAHSDLPNPRVILNMKAAWGASTVPRLPELSKLRGDMGKISLQVMAHPSNPWPRSLLTPESIIPIPNSKTGKGGRYVGVPELIIISTIFSEIVNCWNK